MYPNISIYCPKEKGKCNPQNILKRQGNKHLGGHNGFWVQSCSVKFYTYTLHRTNIEKTLKNACKVNHSITQILTQTLPLSLQFLQNERRNFTLIPWTFFYYRFAKALMWKPTNPHLRNISQLLENHIGFLMNQN